MLLRSSGLLVVLFSFFFYVFIYCRPFIGGKKKSVAEGNASQAEQEDGCCYVAAPRILVGPYSSPLR